MEVIILSRCKYKTSTHIVYTFINVLTVWSRSSVLYCHKGTSSRTFLKVHRYYIVQACTVSIQALISTGLSCTLTKTCEYYYINEVVSTCICYSRYDQEFMFYCKLCLWSRFHRIIIRKSTLILIFYNISY